MEVCGIPLLTYKYLLLCLLPEFFTLIYVANLISTCVRITRILSLLFILYYYFLTTSFECYIQYYLFKKQFLFSEILEIKI